MVAALACLYQMGPQLRYKTAAQQLLILDGVRSGSVLVEVSFLLAS